MKAGHLTEEELCELILENAHVLTCFTCGKTLESQTSGVENDTVFGIMHVDQGESNHPRGPDVRASAYFECTECHYDGLEEDI